MTYNEKACRELHSFLVYLYKRLNEASFGDTKVALYWQRIAPVAKAELGALDNLRYRLSVKSASDLDSFSRAVWRSKYLLESASQDEFALSNLFLTAVRNLMKRLGDNGLLSSESSKLDLSFGERKGNARIGRSTAKSAETDPDIKSGFFVV